MVVTISLEGVINSSIAISMFLITLLHLFLPSKKSMRAIIKEELATALKNQKQAD